MVKQSRRSSELSKLRRARPRPVDLADIQIVESDVLAPRQTLPLMLRPAIDEADLVDWTRGNNEFVDQKLLEHGAILFRGFQTSISVFEQFAAILAPDLVRNYGDLPREKDHDRVYHSTPYPDDQTIEYHNESSHLDSWPRKQFFMCVQSPKERGETPVADCRKVYQALSPELRDKFEERRLMYVRNFIPNLDVSWQSFFRTEDRAEVERRCRESGTDFEWLDGDRLRTRNVALGGARHPRTGEKAFFNQVQLHHVACLPEKYRESMRMTFAAEDMPRSVCYGDGSPIEEAEIEQIRAAFAAETVEVSWQDGDILLLDNMLVAHGRNPFVGPRKIVVAMGDMVHLADL